MLALQVTIQGADAGGGSKCHIGPGSRFRSIRKGVLGLGDWSLSLVPPHPRGEKHSLEEAGTGSPQGMGPQDGPPTHVSGSQDGSVEGIRDQMATGAVGERSGQRCPGSEMGQGQRM